MDTTEDRLKSYSLEILAGMHAGWGWTQFCPQDVGVVFPRPIPRKGILKNSTDDVSGIDRDHWWPTGIRFSEEIPPRFPAEDDWPGRATSQAKILIAELEKQSASLELGDAAVSILSAMYAGSGQGYPSVTGQAISWAQHAICQASRLFKSLQG